MDNPAYLFDKLSLMKRPLSIYRDRCGSGKTIEPRVRLERGGWGRFITGLVGSIGPVHLNLHPEWHGVSVYLPISLLEKVLFYFTLSRLVIGVGPAK